MVGRDDRKPEVAVILAGGYGKRLRPHTRHTPKPLLTTDGEPLVHRLFEALAHAGVHRIIVVSGHLGHLLEKYISGSFSADFEITYARQKNLIGPADALSRAASQLKQLRHDPFLVLAGDYMLPIRYLKELIDFHISGIQQISVSLRIIESSRVRESSLVDMGPNNQIFQIHEKPKDIPATPPYVANSLIYVLPLKSLSFLDRMDFSERGEKEMPDVVNRMIASGMTARGLLQEKLRDWEAAYRAEKDAQGM